MKNPFYITDELTLSRTEIDATNLDEVLKQIRKTMAVLGLRDNGLINNKLHFSQSLFTQGLGQNTSIKNVSLKIDFNEDTLEIQFKTSLKRFLIIALIPLLILLVPKQNLLPSYFLYLYPLYVLIAFAVVKISLGNLSNSIKVFLSK